MVDPLDSNLHINESNEIDPQKICRFTGMYDNNSNEIYESDVIDTGRGLYEVYYYEDEMTYIIGDDYDTHIRDLDKIEVVGNIWDGKEYDLLN